MTKALFELAEEYLTEKGYKMLKIIVLHLPDIWDKDTSSTGKYHKRLDGSLPSIADHTKEMLEAGVKCIGMFTEDRNLRNSYTDAVFTAIILHDALKYGPEGKYFHTVVNHHNQIYDFLLEHKKFIQKYYSESEFDLILVMVRMHNGRWSIKKAERPNFCFSQYPPEVLFIATLDMLSTQSYLGSV